MVEYNRVVLGRETSSESIPMKTNFPGRSFQLWEYKVSHGHMLVRSPKHSGTPKNIDIMFAGVEYADLPRHFAELEIEEPKQADLSFAQERLGKPVEARSVTVLKGGNRRHVVVAATVKIAESDMDIFESPFADPPRTG